MSKKQEVGVKSSRKPNTGAEQNRKTCNSSDPAEIFELVNVVHKTAETEIKKVKSTSFNVKFGDLFQRSTILSASSRRYWG